jgi:hypothetical protein
MNYKSQLKGWAVDRVMEAWKALDLNLANFDDNWLATLKAQADDLTAYAYVLEEDIGATAKSFLELLRQAPDDADTAGLVAMMIGALQDVQNRLSHEPVPVLQEAMQ